MSVLDDFNAEMDFNVEGAEFTESFSVRYGIDEFEVDGVVSHAWKRKESDGRLDPVTPMLIPSVLIPRKIMIARGITDSEYVDLVVIVDGEEMTVASYEDTNPVRLFLKSDYYDQPEYEDPDPEPEPDPPVDPDPEPDPEPLPDVEPEL